MIGTTPMTVKSPHRATRSTPQKISGVPGKAGNTLTLRFGREADQSRASVERASRS
jgi:hypothetical protein